MFVLKVRIWTAILYIYLICIIFQEYFSANYISICYLFNTSLNFMFPLENLKTNKDMSIGRPLDDRYSGQRQRTNIVCFSDTSVSSTGRLFRFYQCVYPLELSVRRPIHCVCGIHNFTDG